MLKRYENKYIILFCILILMTIFTVACSKDIKKTEDDSIVTESPTPVLESNTTVEPTIKPIQIPEPTDEPAVVNPTSEESIEPSTAPTTAPTTTTRPTATPQVTTAPTSKIKEVTKDFKPSNDVVKGKVAISQGDFIFYRAGRFTETNIMIMNTKTSKESILATLKDGQINPGEMYLLGNTLYYHENDDIYRIGVDGENKLRLFKGTASILGIYNDDIVAFDKKTKEIIRITNKGEKTVLVKISSIGPIEVAVLEDGIYYINKKINNTLNGNNPTDRLFYIDFNGNNKIEIDAKIDIYDLKTNGKDLFYISVSDETEDMKINTVENRNVSIIHTLTKEELVTMDAPWYLINTLTLLGVNESHIYYGINTDSQETLAVYSVRTNGENPEPYLNVKDLPEIDPSAYFSSGMIDEGYLKLVLDCDSNPAQIYIINVNDKSSILFKGGYYNSNTIDVLGDTIYYLKTSKLDSYMDFLDNWEYGYSNISVLK